MKRFEEEDMKRTISIIAAATLLAALLFAGCVDVLGPDAGGATQGGTVAAPKAGIVLYIGSAGNTRTLYPSAPEGGFSKYDITFSGTAAAGISPNPMTNVSPAAAIAVNNMGNGDLTITVEAYAEIDDDLDGGSTAAVESKVAEGTKTFTIAADPASRQCRMEVSPYGSGNPGYFAWDLDLTGLTDADKTDGFVGTAKLYTYQFNGVYADSQLVNAINPSGPVSLALDFGALNGDFTFNGTDSSVNKIYEVASGHYFMVVRLENHYQNIGWAEIVKIDSDLITVASKTFDNTSFEATKQLRGTFTNTSGFTSPNIQGFELLLINSSKNISSVHNITKTSGVLEKTSGLTYSVIPQNISGSYNLLVRGKDTSNGNAPVFFTVTGSSYIIPAGATPGVLGDRTIAQLTNGIPGPLDTITNNLNGTPLSKTFTVVTNGSYNVPTGLKAGWLQNAPAGVTLRLDSITSSNTTLNFTLGGAPTSAARGPVEIILPSGTINGVPIALPVDNTAGPLEWDILWSLTKTNTDTVNDGSFTLNITAPAEAIAAGISRAKDGDTIEIVPVPITTGTHPKKYIGAVITKTSNGTLVQNVNEPDTTFTMPSDHVTVTVGFALQPGVVISFNGKDSVDDAINLGAVNLSRSLFSISKNSASASNFITVAMNDSTNTLKVINWHLNGLPVTDKVQSMITGWQSGDPVDSFTIDKNNLHVLFDKPNNESIPTSTIPHTLTATVTPKTLNGTYYSKDIKIVVTE